MVGMARCLQAPPATAAPPPPPLLLALTPALAPVRVPICRSELAHAGQTAPQPTCSPVAKGQHGGDLAQGHVACRHQRYKTTGLAMAVAAVAGAPVACSGSIGRVTQHGPTPACLRGCRCGSLQSFRGTPQAGRGWQTAQPWPQPALEVRWAASSVRGGPSACASNSGTVGAWRDTHSPKPTAGRPRCRQVHTCTAAGRAPTHESGIGCPAQRSARQVACVAFLVAAADQRGGQHACGA